MDPPLTRMRARLEDGRLPIDEPTKTYTMCSDAGHRCDGCDRVILAAELEHELEMADTRRFHLHIGCHGLWIAARILHFGHRPLAPLDQVPRADQNRPRCRSCGSPFVTSLGRVVVAQGVLNSDYRCESCGRGFVHARRI